MKNLLNIDGFIKRGWLIWSKLSEISQNKVKISFPTLSHNNIETHLLKKEPVLAKVFIHRIIPHWVLIVGKKEGEYLMLDPLTQGELTKVSSYGSYIYSIRLMKR